MRGYKSHYPSDVSFKKRLDVIMLSHPVEFFPPIAILLPRPRPRDFIHAAKAIDCSRTSWKVTFSLPGPFGAEMNVLLEYLDMESRRYERKVLGHWLSAGSYKGGSVG